MQGFEGIEEYNNVGALLGLDGAGADDYLNGLKRLPPVQRAKATMKLASTGAPSRGSRAEMEKFFGELPQAIKDSLVKGEQRLADTIIYSIKPVNSKTIKMFETQDDKEVGLRNISNGKLPSKQAFLVSGIQVLVGVAADATKDSIIAAEYKGIELFPAMANGESNLKANKKQLVPETSNAIFRTAGYSFVPVGFYKLANPRLIPDEVQIEYTIELGSTQGIAPNTYVYVAMYGTITTP